MLEVHVGGILYQSVMLFHSLFKALELDVFNLSGHLSSCCSCRVFFDEVFVVICLLLAGRLSSCTLAFAFSLQLSPLPPQPDLELVKDDFGAGSSLVASVRVRRELTKCEALNMVCCRELKSCWVVSVLHRLGWLGKKIEEERIFYHN
eukprot:scaffold4657_cov199-Ochromonas_danica.AAC.1